MNTFKKAFGWGFGLCLGAACASIVMSLPAFLLIGFVIAGTGA